MRLRLTQCPLGGSLPLCGNWFYLQAVFLGDVSSPGLLIKRMRQLVKSAKAQITTTEVSKRQAGQFIKYLEIGPSVWLIVC